VTSWLHEAEKEPTHRLADFFGSRRRCHFDWTTDATDAVDITVRRDHDQIVVDARSSLVEMTIRRS
jgi:hypothetical protein